MRFFFEIFAQDLGRSRAFYTHAIGLAVTRESPAFIVMERGEAKLHLVAREHMPAACAVELCFEVPDIVAAYEQARQSGHSVTEPLRDQPWGRTDFRMFDPDGVYVRVTGQRLIPNRYVSTG